MAVNNQGDLAVITSAKNLCSYILKVTDKSPKKFRFTLTSRLQTYSLDIIENLTMANEVYMKSNRRDALERAIGMRRSFQKKAMTSLKLLDYVAQVSMEQECILSNQYEQITKQISDCRNLLGGWLNSDQRRFDRQMQQVCRAQAHNIPGYD